MLVIGKPFNVEETPYVNRFITFYTLRELWKYYKHDVNDLYKLLFAYIGVKNGKTPYTKILKPKWYDKNNLIDHCSDLIGLDARYFTGEQCLVIEDLSLETWWRFIELWNKHSDQQEHEFNLLKIEVKEKIRIAARESLARQNKDFKVLVYFAQYKSKRSIKLIENDLAKIDLAIQSVRREDLEKVGYDQLKRHRQLLQEYIERVSAICILKGWK